MPGLSYWNSEDVVLGQDDCWNELRIDWGITNYTSYEIYSSEMNAPSDYAEKVDLDSLVINDAEEENFYGEIWTGEGNYAHGFRFFKGWQLSYEGKDIYMQQEVFCVNMMQWGKMIRCWL